MTTIRLAHCGPQSALLTGLKPKEDDVTTVRLAYATTPTSPRGTLALGSQYETRPALLVSYVYLKGFLSQRAKYGFRDWVLDSGAFSAHMSGTEIKLQDFIACAKGLRAQDPTLTEVFALDVIGDWRASLKNCEQMWKQGVEAIPCYHRGEPEDVLRGMARDYPKIALGGVARLKLKQKNAWAQQCFARVWPKPIHGFGFGSEESVMAMPFHSVDATNWEMGPCAFGSWRTYGKMSVRGGKQDLRGEVEWHLKLEQRAKAKWGKALAELQTKESA